MSDRSVSFRVTVRAGIEIDVHLNDSERKCLDGAASAVELSLTAWASQVLMGRDPRDLGLEPGDAVRALLLAAAGATNLRGEAELAIFHHAKLLRRAEERRQK
jgi:hypothetical protein